VKIPALTAPGGCGSKNKKEIDSTGLDIEPRLAGAVKSPLFTQTRKGGDMLLGDEANGRERVEKI
jgi:hypothetical protein